MTYTRFAAFTAAALLTLSMPAIAQTNSPMSAAAPTGAGKTGAPMAHTQTANADGMTMTCQRMMDKEMPMMDSMSDGNKKMMAMKEMGMAKKAMAANKEKTCMMHMKKSMGMMGG